jgi:hypothetical protein
MIPFNGKIEDIIYSTVCTSNTETLLAVPPLKRETLISPLGKALPPLKIRCIIPPLPLKGEGTSEVLTLSKRIIMST